MNENFRKDTDGLYKNIGRKIMGLAKFIFGFGAATSMFYGLILIWLTVEGPKDIAYNTITLGLAMLIGGPIVAFISSWVLYAFGNLVDNVQNIYQMTAEDRRFSENNNSEREPDLESDQLLALFQEGVITVEEFKTALLRNREMSENDR